MASEQDQAFLKSFGIVMLILAGIAVASFFIARIVSDGARRPLPEQILLTKQRTDPVYRVVTDASAIQQVAMAGGAAPAGAAMSGEEVFKAVCHTCHVPGLLGAPQVTDTAEWQKRLSSQGIDQLYYNAIHGIGKMPPKGGKASLSDAEVKAAVNYILARAGVETAAAATPQKHKAEPASQAAGEQAAAANNGSNENQTNAAATSAPAAAGGGAAVTVDREFVKTAKTVGKRVFQGTCHTCHVPGILGAPKVSDTAEWKKRLAKGIDTLYQHAIHGFNAMPPKGGNASLSKQEVMADVDYMLLKSGALTPSAAAATGSDNAGNTQAPAASKAQTTSNSTAQPATGGGNAAAATQTGAADAAFVKTAKTVGKRVFESTCHTCHVPGIIGAPKISDTTEWQQRLASKGIETLHKHAIHGFNAMPPKGGNASLSEDEVIAAVNYMLLKSGAK